MGKKSKTRLSLNTISKVPKPYLLGLVLAIITLGAVLAASFVGNDTKSNPVDNTPDQTIDSTKKNTQTTKTDETNEQNPPANDAPEVTPAAQNPPQPQTPPAVTPPPTGVAGSCGPAEPRIADGYIFCDIDVPESRVPSEVRLLAPYGNPPVKFTCSAGATCVTGTGEEFTYSERPDGMFVFAVTSAGHVEIAIPVERTSSSELGNFKFTSSYWVYGPVEGSDCCGNKYHYDVYNGYIETKL